MSVDTTKDPIYQTYQAIWDCLRSNTTLTTYIPTKNQIDYTGTNRSPSKPGLSGAELPQLRVVLKGLQGQIPRTSSSCNLIVEYAIEILVGDRQSLELTKVIWEIYQAMSWYRTYIFSQVLYNTEYPVKKMSPLKADIDLQEKSEPPIPAGWICVWAADFELFFTTNTVKA